MAAKKKAKGEDFKKEDILQAVVIADSFNSSFAPITHCKPKVRWKVLFSVESYEWCNILGENKRFYCTTPVDIRGDGRGRGQALYRQ